MSKYVSATAKILPEGTKGLPKLPLVVLVYQMYQALPKLPTMILILTMTMIMLLPQH